MADDLVCNFRKCRKKIKGYGWVTSCSHMFCDEDGSREFAASYSCPACSTSLNGKGDIIRMDLHPTELYKSMVLAGQSPENVLEIASRAISFWMYQVSQEKTYLEFLSTKSKERSTNVENYYEQVLTRTKTELTSLRNKVTACKQETSEWKKKFHELHEEMSEKNRQSQRLKTMYDALRRKHINPEILDPESRPTIPDSFTAARQGFSLPLGGQPTQDGFESELHRSFIENSRRPGSDRHMDDRPERGEGDFVFRPLHTPVIDRLPFDDHFTLNITSPRNTDPGSARRSRPRVNPQK